MIVEFLIIMLAMAIGAIGGIYLGMTMQTSSPKKPKRKTCSHNQEDLSQKCEPEKTKPQPQKHEEILQKNNVTEESVITNAQAIIDTATEKKDLRNKMRGQDARYCILKQD